MPGKNPGARILRDLLVSTLDIAIGKVQAGPLAVFFWELTMFSGQPNACVAVLAPSSGAAAIFPHMRDQGCLRLEALFGIPSRLMPSSLNISPTPQSRAADINAAFADPDVVAIVSTIGGDEGVRVLPFLDCGSPHAGPGQYPKILMGFSDVTSLHLYLYKLGHVMLYGGNLLCQFALSGPGMHDYTRECFLEACCQGGPPTVMTCAVCYGGAVSTHSLVT